jgi:uncharacterized DUF497 family protein
MATVGVLITDSRMFLTSSKLSVLKETLEAFEIVWGQVRDTEQMKIKPVLDGNDIVRIFSIRQENARLCKEVSLRY